MTLLAPPAAAGTNLASSEPVAVASADGGATWSTSLHAAPAPLFTVQASLPAGLPLVAGSTRTCANPGTTDATAPTSSLTCNTDAGQGGPIDESTVWSGSNLSTSTTTHLVNPPAGAGFVEFSVTATGASGSTSSILTWNPAVADGAANSVSVTVDLAVSAALASPTVLLGLLVTGVAAAGVRRRRRVRT
jgi:hypothetical protein